MDGLYKVYKEVTAKFPSKGSAPTDSTSFELDGSTATGSDALGRETNQGTAVRDPGSMSISKEEHHYLQAVERGDIVTVHRLLEDKSVNVNCLDLLGRSALLIAIDNDNIEIVELLLHFGAQLGDAILHAINEENVEIVELLLANQQKNKKDLRGFFGGILSSSFTPDITPIILAAHRNNYKILKILLDRGDEIPKPHDVHCGCQECSWKQSDDSLTYSRSRINAYRALASPSLIALSSKDPVLTAFELSWDLRRLSRMENEFRAEYEQLSDQCKEFAVKLLDQVRTSKELEVILNFDARDSLPTAGESGSAKMSLSRLWLAVKYKQKRFVAHANCQQLLASIWYEGLPGFRQSNVLLQGILTALIGFLHPILSIAYIFAPCSEVGNFMRRPFIKFICHTTSYVTFLCLLVLDSLHIKTFLPYTNRNSTARGLNAEDIRGEIPTEIKWLIIFYVFGFIWSEMKCLWYQGLRSFISDMWRIVDFITNMLYITTFTLNLVAYFLVQDALRRKDPYAYAPRNEWDAYDPTVVSEGIYAAANIFSILKLIHIFTINQHLGPMQIALGRMVIDVMKFLIIAMLVCFAYSCGVNQLLSYYAQAENRECESHCQNSSDCSCDTSLANLFEITQSLYFAVYGLLDVKVFELGPGHGFTQFMGKLMYGTYCGVMVVVLMNMFIAMLSNSYQIISDDVDTEWKFARSRLWMSFFSESGTVPPPFNIIPTPKGVLRLLQTLQQKVCKCSTAAKTNRWLKIKKFLKTVRDKDTQYQSVMQDIVTRYIRQSQQNTLDGNISADDINEIKHDISSFRFEVLDVLKNISIGTPILHRTSFGNVPKRRRSFLKRNGIDHRLPTDSEPPSCSPVSVHKDAEKTLTRNFDPEVVPSFGDRTTQVQDPETNSILANSLDCSASADSGIEINHEVSETREVPQIVDDVLGDGNAETPKSASSPED